MGKKIKLKAYVVISPFGHDRNSKDNIYFGGVAHSCASEVAAEEGGFVVPLEGEYDSDQLIEIYQDKVNRRKEEITFQTVGNGKYRAYKNELRQAEHVSKLNNLLADDEKQLEEIKKEFEGNT